MRTLAAMITALLVCGCSQPRTPAAKSEVSIAAAASLSRVLPELSSAFEKHSGIHVVSSLGATSQLAQQIENGAPFSVFLSADVEHVDQLIQKGLAAAESRFIYARGELVLWAPRRPDIASLRDLSQPGVRNIAIAKPELAPYGAAALEALKNLALWDAVEKKAVYASSAVTAKQLADTGNADAAFTALSLIIGEPGSYFLIEGKAHKPLDQALCVVKNSASQESARAFASFLKTPEAAEIFRRFGYGKP